MTPRQKRRIDAGNLTIGMRRALVVAQRNNGLVQMGSSFRASFAPGAEKVKLETVHALLARALLMRFGEKLVVLTEAGKVEAERAETMARNAVQKVNADRRERASKSRGPRQPHAGQFQVRLPYADN